MKRCTRNFRSWFVAAFAGLRAIPIHRCAASSREDVIEAFRRHADSPADGLVMMQMFAANAGHEPRGDERTKVQVSPEQIWQKRMRWRTRS